MDIEQRSEDHSKWTPETPRLVIDAKKQSSTWAAKETVKDDAIDPDDDGEALREAIKIEEARKKAMNLAEQAGLGPESGMEALQRKLVEETVRRERDEANHAAYVPDALSIPESRMSGRDKYNNDLAKLAASGPMEFKDGAWVKHIPYAGETQADDVSEDIPRPVRPSRDGEQPSA
jgi:hypothetical protein